VPVKTDSKLEGGFYGKMALVYINMEKNIAKVL
jgi:hypothetical protein